LIVILLASRYAPPGEGEESRYAPPGEGEESRYAPPGDYLF
jgi:hypothetical protein